MKLRPALIIPLCLTACVVPPNPAAYSLDQVIASTIQQTRKGLADGTRDVIDPNTGMPYPAAGLPVCSLTETWAISESNTGSQGGGVTAGPGGPVPIGITLSASASSTRSAASTVVIAFQSPLCSSGGGGGGAPPAAPSTGGGARSPGAGAANVRSNGPLGLSYVFVPEPKVCPGSLVASALIERNGVKGHNCYPRGSTIRREEFRPNADYPLLPLGPNQ